MPKERSKEFRAITISAVKAITKRAALFTIEDGERDVWVPLSLIFEGDKVELERGEGRKEINIEAWFVKKEMQ